MKKLVGHLFGVILATILITVVGACTAPQSAPESTKVFVQGEPVKAPYGCVELRKREGKDAC